LIISDGAMVANDNQGGAPNYYPNSFGGPETSSRAKLLEPPYKVVGDVNRRDNGDEDNFTQPRIFWESVLDETARERLVDNIANHLVNAADFIQDRTAGNFAKVNSDFGKQLTEALKTKKKHPQA
jgi:catalase